MLNSSLSLKWRAEKLDMWHVARRFWTNERGQDITEYSLLLAFVVIAAAAILLVNASSIYGIWVTSNGIISQANVVSHGS